MPGSATFTFDDPIPYQAAIRGGEVAVSVTAKGDFRAELIQVDFDTLWMQSGWENLPRVIRSMVSPNRAVVFFLADADQPTLQYGGLELRSDVIAANRPSALIHIHSQYPCRWAAMSLPPKSLSAASRALLGRELTNPPELDFVHPSPHRMTRLVRLHAAARQLTDTAPDILFKPEVCRTVEHELIHSMVTCLADEERTNVRSAWRQHTAIIHRFEEVLAANCERPMYLTEICAAVGVSERTLRLSCQEHLGMGPIRYLWLRRMHLARRALLHAEPAKATVTQIATDHGFWELGRFSVAYQALFGEAPSVSLHKPPDFHRAIQTDPLSFGDSVFA
jgi:AraC-like DNA-binding protein